LRVVSKLVFKYLPNFSLSFLQKNAARKRREQAISEKKKKKRGPTRPLSPPKSTYPS
jgi:hypothetical protein